MVRINLQLFATKKTNEEVAKEVLAGKWGNGEARKTALANAGYKYSEIQSLVNTAKNNSQNTQTNTASTQQSSNSNKSNTTSTTKTSTNKTSTKKATTTKPKGVDQSIWNKANSSFAQSDKVTERENEMDDAYGNLKDIAGVTDIISDETWDKINTPFVESEAYKQAMDYTNGLLEKLNSGRTSYTDQIQNLMNQIQNREDFEYDVDKDQLFQQALASAMGDGKSAMQDTIGQASALTGGYGSTYATSAGNQAYNSFIEDAYANLPEYYQMALQSYQMEGEEMYRQLDMLNTADATEYQRTYNAWAANFDTANQQWNKDFSVWESGVNQAVNSANLQLNEHGQLVQNASILYDAAYNQYESLYAKEYQKWSDEVNNAMNLAGMQNTDWWNKTNFDESVRQFNQNYALEQAKFAESQRQYNQSREDSKKADATYKEPTSSQKQKALEAYNNGGQAEYDKYIDSLPSNVDIDEIAGYVFGSGDSKGYGELPIAQRTFTVIDDGGTNWFGGVDGNVKVKDQYGNEYTLDQLKKYDKDLAKALSGVSKGASINGAQYNKK